MKKLVVILVVLGSVTINAATLIARYQLEESGWSGVTGEILDFSGNNRHGQLIANASSLTFTPALAGDPGTCGYGSLVQGALSLPNLPVSTQIGDVTAVAFWMRWSGQENMMPIGWYQQDLWFSSGNFGFNTAGSDIYGISSAGLDGSWHHIVAEFTNGQVVNNRLYVDGVLQSLNQQQNTPTNSRAYVNSELRVGGWQSNTGYRFTGDIDGVRVYNGSLTSAEIATAMQFVHACPAVAPSANTDQYLTELQFEENSWSGQVAEVRDKSGNNRHGQLVANATPVGVTPAIVTNPGTCGYAELNNGSLRVQNLAVVSGIGQKTSVAFWMRWSGQDNVMPMGWYLHDLWIYGGDFGFNTGNGDIYGISASGLAGGWHHVVAEFTNGNVTNNRLFIDGVEQSLSQRRSSPNNARAFVNSEIRIGGWIYNSVYRFYGDIDEFKVFDGVLSDTAITTLMAETHTCGVKVPQGEWHFDGAGWNGTANEVVDSSGFARHGVATNVVTGTGLLCNAADMRATGIGDYVTLGAAAFDSLGDFTITTWFKTSKTTNQALLSGSNGSSGNDNELIYWLPNSSQVVPYLNGLNSGAIALPDIADNTWHFMSWTRDGLNNCIYVDSQMRGCTSLGATPITIATLIVGQEQDSNGGSFVAAQSIEGEVDEMLVFDSALSQSELAAIQANHLAGKNWDGADRDCASVGASKLILSHDNQGIYCAAESLSVTAVDSSNQIVTSYGNQITLTTNTSRGDWSLVAGNGSFANGTSDDGVATYQFNAADNGVATFLLSYQQGVTPIDIDGFQTDDISVSDDDTEGTMTFAPSGFTVTATALTNPPPSPINDALGFQTAGTNFVVNVAAFGTTDDDPECGIIEAYTGAKGVKFWANHVNPATGSVLPTVDGAGIATTLAAATDQAVVFLNGQAQITAKYKDAGLINIQIQDDFSFSTPITGGTGNFVVKPDRLVITQIRSSGGFANPGASSMIGTGFVAAEEAFEVDVEAQDAEGSRTPNFGLETPKETLAVASNVLVLPVGGRNGSTGDVTNGDQFIAISPAGVFRNSQVSFDEVGIIRLMPRLTDGDYLVAGDVTGQLSGNVGRFRPQTFALTASSLVNACSGFSYMAHAAIGMTYSVQARGVAGSLLQNYDTSLIGSAGVASVLLVAEDNDAGVDLGGRLAVASTSWQLGVNSVTTANLAFNRLVSPDGPFELLNIGIKAVDTLDGITLASVNLNADTTGDCSITSNCTAQSLGAPLRLTYGRLAVLPSYGPENQNLDVTLEAQQFMASVFLRHNADACTNYQASQVNLAGFTANLDAGETNPILPISATSLVAGRDNVVLPLLLSAPGFGNEGTTEVTFTVPSYLQFNWQGLGEEDPVGTATFGRFRGHDRILLWKELR